MSDSSQLNITVGDVYLGGIIYNVGTISTDTTWTVAEGYHLIKGSFTIPEGVTLTIEPGVVVEMGSGVQITVNGTLNANGATFTWADGANQWRGIGFNGAGSTNSRLDGCILEHAGGYVSSSPCGVIHITDSSPTITGCTINNSNALQGIWIEYGSPVISDNIISGMTSYALYNWSETSPTVTGNTISGNKNGIRIDPTSSGTYQGNNFINKTEYGLYYSGSSVINASNCYWGDPTGPLDNSDDRSSGGWYNPHGLGDKVSDHVKYTPWKLISYDTDKDNIPDDLEIEIFGDLITASATSDHDGDGFSNILEYRRNTDPTDPLSHPSRAMPSIPLLLE
jgi:parallel beta-helix repeat protein